MLLVAKDFCIATRNDFIHSSNALRKSYLTNKFAFTLLVASSRSVLLSNTAAHETKDAVFYDL